jgi:hypothetical protein
MQTYKYFRREFIFLYINKIKGACEKSKTCLVTYIGPPISVNFCQTFWNLSRDPVPLRSFSDFNLQYMRDVD